MNKTDVAPILEERIVSYRDRHVNASEDTGSCNHVVGPDLQCFWSQDVFGIMKMKRNRYCCRLQLTPAGPSPGVFRAEKVGSVPSTFNSSPLSLPGDCLFNLQGPM